MRLYLIWGVLLCAIGGCDDGSEGGSDVGVITLGTGGEGGQGEGGQGEGGQGEGGQGEGGQGEGGQGEGGQGEGGQGEGGQGEGGQGGAVCMPDCGDRTCGPDGCGGICGPSCDAGQICNMGRCVMGECPDDTFDCDGVCSSLVDDPENCGSCGGACARRDGVLTQCIDAECYLNCPGLEGEAISLDFDRDVENCGRCGNVCPAPDGTATCQSGACACPMIPLSGDNLSGRVCDGVCRVWAENCEGGCCPDLGSGPLRAGAVDEGMRATATLTLDTIAAVELTIGDGDRCPDVYVFVYTRPDPVNRMHLVPYEAPQFRNEHMQTWPLQRDGARIVLTHFFETSGGDCSLTIPYLLRGHHTINIVPNAPVANLSATARIVDPPMFQGPGRFDDIQRMSYSHRILRVPRDMDTWIYLKSEADDCPSVRLYNESGLLIAESDGCVDDEPAAGDPPTLRRMLPRGRYIVETYISDNIARDTSLWVLDEPPIPEGAISQRGSYPQVGPRGYTLFFPEGGDFIIRTRTATVDCLANDTYLTVLGPGVSAENDNADSATYCSLIYGRFRPNTAYRLLSDEVDDNDAYDILVQNLSGRGAPLNGPGRTLHAVPENQTININLRFPAGGEYTLTTADTDGDGCRTNTTLELIKDAQRVERDASRNNNGYCSRIVHHFEAGEDYVLLLRGLGWRRTGEIQLLIEGDEQPDPNPDPDPDPDPDPGPGEVLVRTGVYNRPAIAANAEDVIQMRFARDTDVTVRTAGPDDGPCPGDTVLDVDSRGRRVESNDDDRGVCSGVNLNLEANEDYTLTVYGFSNRAVPPYSIVIE